MGVCPLPPVAGVVAVGCVLLPPSGVGLGTSVFVGTDVFVGGGVAVGGTVLVGGGVLVGTEVFVGAVVLVGTTVLVSMKHHPDKCKFGLDFQSSSRKRRLPHCRMPLR
jgi:UDP-3-O-[3-hydroxymyristoyl] glucosamine N-acyltransferase